MKLSFSLFLMAQLSFSAPLHISYIEEESIKVLKEVLNKKFQVPESLIIFQKHPRPCQQRVRSLIHLCLKDQEMKLVQYDAQAAKEMFSIFTQMNKELNDKRPTLVGPEQD